MINKILNKILNRILIILISFLPLALAECAKSDTTASQSGIADHVRSDERHTENSAQWTFSQPLRNLNSHEHFVLAAEFLSNGASLTLHSHFNGFAWRDGWRLKFLKNERQIVLEMTPPGLANQNFVLPGDWLTPDNRLKVRIEVHNNTPGGSRILIWKYMQSLQGERETPRPFISASNADFDSQTLRLVFPNRGHGILWGVEYESARIIEAYREAPYGP